MKEEKKNNILKIIEERIDGTYNKNLMPVYYNTGFFVSILWNSTPANIKIFLWNRLLKYFKIFYLGIWEGYIDISIYTNNLKFAVFIGKIFNQIAIWDCKENKEIYLRKNE